MTKPRRPEPGKKYPLRLRVVTAGVERMTIGMFGIDPDDGRPVSDSPDPGIRVHWFGTDLTKLKPEVLAMVEDMLDEALRESPVDMSPETGATAPAPTAAAAVPPKEVQCD